MLLTVIPAPPVIAQQPSSLTVREGQSASFSVTATEAQLGYQWRKGGTGLSGMTVSAAARLVSAHPAAAGRSDCD